jgi:hypothetical protein
VLLALSGILQRNVRVNTALNGLRLRTGLELAVGFDVVLIVYVQPKSQHIVTAKMMLDATADGQAEFINPIRHEHGRTDAKAGFVRPQRQPFPKA